MNISIINEQESLPISEDRVQAIVRSCVLYEGQNCDEVSIFFVTKEVIAELHEEFFDDPTPTDCISFPIDTEETAGFRLLGEIFVCPEVAIEYSKTHGLKSEREETLLYVVHGLLHLMGYDDIEDDAIVEMRKAEKRHLDHLKKQGLEF